jgi:ABC-type sugar transport system permease subunit
MPSWPTRWPRPRRCRRSTPSSRTEDAIVIEQARGTGAEVAPAPRPAAPARRPRRAGTTALGFLWPALLVLLAVRVVPLAEAAWLALTEWDGYGTPELVGLENFRSALGDAAFRQSLANNGLIVASMPVWVLGPLALAIALQRRVPGWRLLRLAYLFPALLSPVIVGTYYSVLLRFDGPVNDLLRAAGLGGLARDWLGEPSTAMPVTIAVIIWASFGVGVLLYMAALGGVDQSLYDAARVDGASTLRLHWHVTLPQVLPVIEFYTVVVLVSSFTVLFPYVYTLTGGGPGRATSVLDFYVYSVAFQGSRFGYASAIGVLLLALLLCLVGVTFRLFARKLR